MAAHTQPRSRPRRIQRPQGGGSQQSANLHETGCASGLAVAIHGCCCRTPTDSSVRRHAAAVRIRPRAAAPGTQQLATWLEGLRSGRIVEGRLHLSKQSAAVSCWISPESLRVRRRILGRCLLAVCRDRGSIRISDSQHAEVIAASGWRCQLHRRHLPGRCAPREGLGSNPTLDSRNDILRDRRCQLSLDTACCAHGGCILQPPMGPQGSHGSASD
jgi:hypothetical protein